MSTFIGHKRSGYLSRRQGLTVTGIILLALALGSCTDNLLEPGKIYSRLYDRGTLVESEWPVGLQLVVPEMVKEGTTIKFRMILTNLGDEMIEIHTNDAEFDMVVTRPDEAVLWERLFGNDLNAALTIAHLQPGDTLQWDTAWRQRDIHNKRVAPGPLYARGVLLGNMADRSGYLWTEPVEFTIVK